MRGRPKGSTGQQNQAIKDMIRAALDDAGGKQYFIDQSKLNPTAFLSLIGKLIPADVNNKISGAISVDASVRFIRPEDRPEDTDSV